MFILLKNNLVVQKQPNMAEGFVWTDRDVVCGQVEKDGVFSNPKPKALPDNLSAFEAVWIPFRSGFFKSEVANDV